MDRVGPSGYVDLDIAYLSGQRQDQYKRFVLRKIWDGRGGPRIDVLKLTKFKEKPDPTTSWYSAADRKKAKADLIVWKDELRAEEADGWRLFSLRESPFEDSDRGGTPQLARVLNTFNMSGSETVSEWAVGEVLSRYCDPENETSFNVALRLFNLPSSPLEMTKIYHFGTNDDWGARKPWLQVYHDEIMETEKSLEFAKRQRMFDDAKLYADRSIAQLRARAHTWAKATVGAGQR
jgi:hypothetical protein